MSEKPPKGEDVSTPARQAFFKQVGRAATGEEAAQVAAAAAAHEENVKAFRRANGQSPQITTGE